MVRMFCFRILLLSLFSSVTFGDVLLKKGEPVDNGKGTVDGDVIHWTQCDGKKVDYLNKDKEYEIKKGDTCSDPKGAPPHDPDKKAHDKEKKKFQ